MVGSTAAANDEFRLGVQGGLPNWGLDVEVSALGVATDVDADVEPALGLVGQYIMRAGDDDGSFFVGIEAGFTSESAAGAQEVSVLDTPVMVDAEMTWATDLVWLGGFDLGNVSLFGGNMQNVSVFGTAGASYAHGEVAVSIPSAGATGSDEGKHFGWKFGGGVEFDLGTSAAVQIRANYTTYASATYADQGVSLAVEPSAFEIRAILVYKFDAGDVLGIFK